MLAVGWPGAWPSATRLLAAIPLDAANEPVMTKQLAVQALTPRQDAVVRLRRIARNDPGALDIDDDADDEF